MTEQNRRRAVRLFVVVLALTALANGLGVDHIMAIIASPIMGLIRNAWGVQYVFLLAMLSALF